MCPFAILYEVTFRGNYHQLSLTSIWLTPHQWMLCRTEGDNWAKDSQNLKCSCEEPFKPVLPGSERWQSEKNTSSTWGPTSLVWYDTKPCSAGLHHPRGLSFGFSLEPLSLGLLLGSCRSAQRSIWEIGNDRAILSCLAILKASCLWYYSVHLSVHISSVPVHSRPGTGRVLLQISRSFLNPIKWFLSKEFCLLIRVVA